jgi:hypothetical protein
MPMVSTVGYLSPVLRKKQRTLPLQRTTNDGCMPMERLAAGNEGYGPDSIP